MIAARPLAADRRRTDALWLRRDRSPVLFVLLVIGALLPLIYGTWRLTIGGVRLVSIASADKPLTLAMFALLG